jgi:transposase-like protein
MRGRKSPNIVVLTEEERNELNRWTRSPTMPSGLVRRARAVLLVSEGKSFSEAGRMVGMGRRIVRVWVCRFNAQRIEGLQEKPGRGRKPTFSP